MSNLLRKVTNGLRMIPTAASPSPDAPIVIALGIARVGDDVSDQNVERRAELQKAVVEQSTRVANLADALVHGSSPALVKRLQAEEEKLNALAQESASVPPPPPVMRLQHQPFLLRIQGDRVLDMRPLDVPGERSGVGSILRVTTQDFARVLACRAYEQRLGGWQAVVVEAMGLRDGRPTPALRSPVVCVGVANVGNDWQVSRYVVENGRVVEHLPLQNAYVCAAAISALVAAGSQLATLDFDNANEVHLMTTYKRVGRKVPEALVPVSVAAA